MTLHNSWTWPGQAVGLGWWAGGASLTNSLPRLPKTWARKYELHWLISENCTSNLGYHEQQNQTVISMSQPVINGYTPHLCPLFIFAKPLIRVLHNCYIVPCPVNNWGLNMLVEFDWWPWQGTVLGVTRWDYCGALLVDATKFLCFLLVNKFKLKNC